MAGHGSDGLKPPARSTATQTLIRLSTLYLVPMVWKATLELRVPTIMAKAGAAGGAEAFLTPEEIAQHIPKGNAFTVKAVGRFLRLLTAHGVFKESVKETGGGTVERRYALNEVSRQTAEDEESSLVSGVLFYTDKVNVDCGYFLSEMAIEGEQPFVKAHGIDTWTYYSQNEKVDQMFNTFMANVSQIAVGDVARNYAGFRDLKGTLVDVAGGYGASISSIVKIHPHLKGINFDRPHVIAQAPSSPGVEHVAGDMFEGVPSGDAILMKWILHDWDDEACLKILKNVLKALPPHGKLIIVEGVLPTETPSDELTQSQLQLDILMLTINVRGRERSEAEYRKLALDAGFSRLELVFIRDAFITVMEAFV